MESKVTKEKHSVKMTVMVTPAEMLKYFDEAYNAMAPEVKIDGFRPGKAPRNVIEEAIGVSRIMSQAIDKAIEENYYAALIKNKLIPVNQPSMVIDKYPKYGATVEEIAENFEFTAEFEVIPEFELGDYSKIKVEKTKKEEVKDSDIEKILTHLQKQKADFAIVDRAAAKGDFAEINFEGSIGHVRKDAMCSKNHPLVLGENTLIPGFEDEILGMKKGEEKTFPIKFPKDYHSKEYAGKEAEFKVTLNELKEVKLPAVDAEFAKNFGHETPEELKKAIAENLDKELVEKSQNELEAKIIEKMLPLVKLEVPESLITRETDRMIGDYSRQLESQGMNFEQYLASIKKTDEEMRKEMRTQAEKNVKVGLMLGKVIEKEKIDADAPDAAKKAIEHLVKTVVK
ncbi:MAG: trigger factor [bacterium]